MLIYNLFKKKISNRKDKIIIFENSEYNYQDILELIDLAENKINKNHDSISIISENSIFHIILYLLSSKLNRNLYFRSVISFRRYFKNNKNVQNKNIFCNDKIKSILKKNKIKILMSIK